MERIYFDHASTTPVDPAVVVAMTPYFSEQFGNVSSPHAFGQATHKALEDAREHLAKFIGAKSEEIIFNSGQRSRIITLLSVLHVHKRIRESISSCRPLSIILCLRPLIT